MVVGGSPDHLESTEMRPPLPHQIIGGGSRARAWGQGHRPDRGSQYACLAAAVTASVKSGGDSFDTPLTDAYHQNQPRAEPSHPKVCGLAGGGSPQLPATAAAGEALQG